VAFIIAAAIADSLTALNIQPKGIGAIALGIIAALAGVYAKPGDGR
jgi:hypothetical protein